MSPSEFLLHAWQAAQKDGASFRVVQEDLRWGMDPAGSTQIFAASIWVCLKIG